MSVANEGPASAGTRDHASRLAQSFGSQNEVGAPKQDAAKPFTPEQVQRYGDLIKMGTHMPELLKVSQDIEKNGFTSENVEKLKAMEGDMKNVITPENVQFLKNLDTKTLDNLFSKENLDQLREASPELAERLTGERVKEVTSGLRQLQQVDQDQVNDVMNQMAPWVNTLDEHGNVQEGHLNMLDRMIGDPNKLGGGDRTFSQEDLLPVTRAAMKHGVTHQKIDEAIRSDSRVQFNRWGGRRLPIVREAIVQGAHKRATPEVVAQKAGQKTKDVLGSRGLPTSTVPRNFTSSEMNRLFQAGEQAAGLKQNVSQNSDVQNMEKLQQGIIGPLRKSVDLSDGVSHAEIHNLSEVANFGYRLLDQFRGAL